MRIATAIGLALAIGSTGCVAYRQIMTPREYEAEQRSRGAEAETEDESDSGGTEPADEVRVVDVAPKGCQSKGRLQAKGESNRTTFARLKLDAVDLGANTVFISRTGPGWIEGEAYLCPL